MILIIDNYDSFTYNLYQAIAQIHPDVRVIRNDKISVKEIMNMRPHGIILSPGPGRPETAGISIELIQTLIELDPKNTIPLLGVCLGHQAITVALGGKVIHAQEIFHGKDDLIFHHGHDIYRHLPNPFKAGRYHSLIAERQSLPACLVIEAENSRKLIMGIRHTNLPIFGVQFHPESILTPEGQQLLAQFVQLCISEVSYRVAS